MLGHGVEVSEEAQFPDQLFIRSVNHFKPPHFKRHGYLGLLVQPLNSAAMRDLHSAVLSQTQEILHFLGVSEIVFFKKPHKWTEELGIR